jgi:hypothetical protein
MPQGNLGANVAKIIGGAAAPLVADAQGTLMVSQGGVSTMLNITAPSVVKATKGRLCKVVIISPGTTSGAFTLNDAATIGAASAANVLWTLPYNGANNIVGAVFAIDMPVSNGIVVSAVPGGGSPVIAVSFV